MGREERRKPGAAIACEVACCRCRVNNEVAPLMSYLHYLHVVSSTPMFASIASKHVVSILRVASVIHSLHATLNSNVYCRRVENRIKAGAASRWSSDARAPEAPRCILRTPRSQTSRATQTAAMDAAPRSHGAAFGPPARLSSAQTLPTAETPRLPPAAALRSRG